MIPDRPLRTTSATPRVTMITVNYRTPHFIRHLLAGLDEARPDLDFEYILVDNASGDGTPELVRERFPWARVIEAPANRGYGAGNNLAIREARGEYILLLNPDLMVFEGQIERWIEWMDAHPDVAISGPRIYNPDGTDQDSCYAFPNLFTPVLRRTALGRLAVARPHMDRYLMRGMDRNAEQDVDWVLGAAMLIRKSALEEVGHFDERFFMYFEEADLCRRMWASGRRVAYVPHACFTHYHKRESRLENSWQFFTNKLARVHLVSGLKYFLKYFGKPHPRNMKNEESITRT